MGHMLPSSSCLATGAAFGLFPSQAAGAHLLQSGKRRPFYSKFKSSRLHRLLPWIGPPLLRAQADKVEPPQRQQQYFSSTNLTWRDHPKYWQTATNNSCKWVSPLSLQVCAVTLRTLSLHPSATTVNCPSSAQCLTNQPRKSQMLLDDSQHAQVALLVWKIVCSMLSRAVPRTFCFPDG